jgi:hypothetical protein
VVLLSGAALGAGAVFLVGKKRQKRDARAFRDLLEEPHAVFRVSAESIARNLNLQEVSGSCHEFHSTAGAPEARKDCSQ